MKLTRDPLRLILGGILVVLGVLALLNLQVVPLGGTIFTVAGVIAGVLLLFKTRYL